MRKVWDQFVHEKGTEYFTKNTWNQILEDFYYYLVRGGHHKPQLMEVMEVQPDKPEAEKPKAVEEVWPKTEEIRSGGIASSDNEAD